jgi:hypothetical protein
MVVPFNGVISGQKSLIFWVGLVWAGLVQAEYQMLSDEGMARVTAQADLPSIPLLDGVDFNVQSSGLEIDLDVQADIGSIEWIDSDGIGENGSQGSLILKGVHIGSSNIPITAEQVRDSTPFQPTDLAQIHGMLIEADPQKGTLITINKLGDTQGNGLDLIVNDIYFGKDLSSEGQRGLGLLVEDLSNFVSDDYLTRINQTFGLSLASVDDGMNTQGGNYYPIRLRMQPIEGGVETVAETDGLGGSFEDLASIAGLGETSMILDAQFVLYVEKIAVYRDDWEAGIQGLMVYQGIDTNNDGIEDTVGPATLTNMRMETVEHTRADGSNVQAMHFSNVDFKADIAMESIYIGNPQTGSLGSLHIDNLHIQDTKMWIYPND